MTSNNASAVHLQNIHRNLFFLIRMVTYRYLGYIWLRYFYARHVFITMVVPSIQLMFLELLCIHIYKDQQMIYKLSASRKQTSTSVISKTLPFIKNYFTFSKNISPSFLACRNVHVKLIIPEN